MPNEPRRWHAVTAVIAVLVLIAGIVAAFTTVEVTQRAQGGDLKSIRKTQDNFRPRIRKLETGQAGMKQRLQAIHDEQKATRILNASGRREILDAIKSLGNRIPSR